MPIYTFQCPVCDKKAEEICQIGDITKPICHCGEEMVKTINFPAMVKVKGMGGYPSRRKFYKGTAPYCGGSKEFNPITRKGFNAKEEA